MKRLVRLNIVCGLFPALVALLFASGCDGNGDDDDNPAVDASGGDGEDGDVQPIEACAVEVEARGPHTCVLDEEGVVSCWGRNHRGQLGAGTTGDSFVPLEVDHPAEAIQVDTGVAHTCALLADGRVFCWGFGEDGALGDGGASDRSSPVRVQGIDDADQISLGGFHSCALRADGQLLCWGDNAHGQIGDGASGDGADRTEPVQVVSSVTDVAAGEDHTCVLGGGGTVTCWGDSSFGQLGDGKRDSRSTAAPVMEGGEEPLTGASELEAGAFHTCAVMNGGPVLCWGRNDAGQLGAGESGEDRLVPVEVAGLSDPDDLVAGQLHTCALSDGEVLCWGNNDVGQLGTGDFSTRVEPTAVIELDPASDLAAGDIHTCALSDGDVFCWGYNQNGQLGAPPSESSATPLLARDC